MSSFAFFLENSSIDGRYVILVCTNNYLYTVVGVYTPNSHQGKFLSKVFKQIAKVSQASLIVGGDLNSVAD